MAKPDHPPILDRRYVPKGSVIIREGDDGASAYLVQSGRVRVFSEADSGKKVELSIMGPGQIFGEMALIFDSPRTASVEAVEDCNLITITRMTLQDKLARSDPTIQAIVKMLVGRITDANNAMMNRKDCIEDLKEIARIVYQNVHYALPDDETKHSFKASVLPKLDFFLNSLSDFSEHLAQATAPQEEDKT